MNCAVELIQIGVSWKNIQLWLRVQHHARYFFLALELHSSTFCVFISNNVAELASLSGNFFLQQRRQISCMNLNEFSADFD